MKEDMAETVHSELCGLITRAKKLSIPLTVDRLEDAEKQIRKEIMVLVDKRMNEVRRGKA